MCTLRALTMLAALLQAAQAPPATLTATWANGSVPLHWNYSAGKWIGTQTLRDNQGYPITVVISCWSNGSMQLGWTYVNGQGINDVHADPSISVSTVSTSTTIKVLYSNPSSPVQAFYGSHSGTLDTITIQ